MLGLFPLNLLLPVVAFRRNGWKEEDEVKASLFGNFTKDFLVLKLNKVMLTDGGSILINALISIKLLCETIGTCKLTCFGKNDEFYTCVTGIASE